MDRVPVSEAGDAGSIPAWGTVFAMLMAFQSADFIEAGDAVRWRAGFSRE